MTNSVLVDNIYQSGFHIIDNFLETKHFASLKLRAQSLYEAGQFTPAKVGKQHKAMLKKDLRLDQIYWIDNQHGNVAIQAYLLKIKQLMATLNQAFFLSMVDFEMHFAIYPPGSFYKKHIDQFSTNKNRCISCVFYLNENWESSSAGELKLYNEEDELLFTILPTRNRFVCFRSDLVHEVCVTQKTRYSIAGWMKTRAA